MFSALKKAITGTPSVPSEGTFIDSTLRPIAFGIPYTYASVKEAQEAAKKVGASNFKKYEHALYISAQLSRLVYCDTGILCKVANEALGKNNDEVNKLITEYDKIYINEKRYVLTSQPDRVKDGRPMESYALTGVPSPYAEQWGTYISSPEDCTCLLMSASKLAANPNSIFKPSDTFVVFKGSSTVNNFKHDLQSQFTTPEELNKLVSKIGITRNNPFGNVTASFVKPICNIWKELTAQFQKIRTEQNGRLFVTGHSLGGAYATFFATLAQLAKEAGIEPYSTLPSIHLITFGAPTLLSDTARNSFNTFLDSGSITLDRVVSQKVASRTGVPIPGVTGTGNNIIPHIPAGFAHPGYRPLATEFQPEARGRPYSLDMIRKFYGVSSDKRGRNSQTWPFDIFVAEAEGDVNNPELASSSSGFKTGNQDGGGPEKDKYSNATNVRMPNFISVSGATKAAVFAHGEYLGMFFFGAFRLPGMKNPASGSNLASFRLTNLGVEIIYVPFTPVPVFGIKTNVGGRRKTRKVRKSRKGRK